MFKIFFEGAYECDQIYKTYCSIKNFGITDFVVFDDVNKITVVITLTSPGILIGRGGETIDSLKKYYNDMLFDEFNKPISIDLIESKLWY